MSLSAIACSGGNHKVAAMSATTPKATTMAIYHLRDLDINRPIARCLILTQPLYRGTRLGQYQANVLKAVQRGPSGKRDHPDGDERRDQSQDQSSHLDRALPALGAGLGIHVRLSLAASVRPHEKPT